MLGKRFTLLNKKITEQLKQILNESPMYQNPRKDFEEFYDFVKSGIEPKKSYFLFDNKLRNGYIKEYKDPSPSVNQPPIHPQPFGFL